jgi:Ca-activated chloride channel family protein
MSQLFALRFQLPALSFVWPMMLWLLVLVPLVAALYVWHDMRRRRVAVRYPALRTVGVALRGALGWRRHLPAVLLLLGLAALLVAIARPRAEMMLPSRIDTVILAMDTSGSMKAQDIKPTRMQAAQHAAKVFLAEQPDGVRVGLVAVAGTAALAQSPSRSKDDVAASIDRLQPQRGTALGSGLIIALTTLLPQAGIDAARFMNTGNAKPPDKPRAVGSDPAPPQGAAQGEAAEPGSYRAGAIVLLSDGDNNAGPDAIQAAKVAAEHGVRIYTVGVGTPEGTVLTVDGWSARVKLDEGVLKKVADMTGAEYFRVEDAAELKAVYRSLSARLAFEKQDMVEITALFTALGALLAVCAGLLSLWWFGRVL